jgi:hypothetical protein
MEEDEIKRKLNTQWHLAIAQKSSLGKPEGKEECARPRSGWEDNMKAIVKETGCGGVDWI